MENTQEMISDLYEKIEGLENKLDLIIQLLQNERPSQEKKKTPDYIPEEDFQEWLKKFIVKQEHLTVVFEKCIMEGFKECLEENIDMNNIDMPIWAANTRNKHIYIYEEEEWRNMTAEDINLLVETIWRKMLQYYFVDNVSTDENEDIRDINKKKLVDMRKKLVEKHSKNIEKYLISKCKV